MLQLRSMKPRWKRVLNRGATQFVREGRGCRNWTPRFGSPRRTAPISAQPRTGWSRGLSVPEGVNSRFAQAVELLRANRVVRYRERPIWPDNWLGGDRNPVYRRQSGSAFEQEAADMSWRCYVGRACRPPRH